MYSQGTTCVSRITTKARCTHLGGIPSCCRVLRALLRCVNFSFKFIRIGQSETPHTRMRVTPLAPPFSLFFWHSWGGLVPRPIRPIPLHQAHDEFSLFYVTLLSALVSSMARPLATTYRME